MKRCIFLAVPTLVLLAAFPARGVPPQEAAGSLVQRLLPGRSQAFVFETIPPQDGRDVFELESRDGRLVVRGNSALSMAFGLNWYLKYYGHCNASINGSQLNLPSPLPLVEKRLRLASWARSRYLLNYCTFGYVKPWWDWAQWEKFIDWMALNGVNMPLAVTGQEGVWQAACRKLGMSDAEIEAFLPGPPYLPFCWMGCLDGHGGPLPKDWTARHVALGQKIVARERELGMTPVLQGFTGHIPQALAKKFPGTKTQRIHWCEFETCMLDPQDPLFQKVATLFMEEQARLFGSDHLYDADSFIEMSPPSGDLKYLADIGRAIYEGMAKADPKAVWLLQGWTFMNQASFWKQDRIRAFLDAVPNDHMLVLDLFCERTPVWNTTQGFYGKPWVWSFVYNFGDDTILGGSGPLERLNDLAAVRRHPLGQKVCGVGMMMEGYGHSPLVFDLMYEMAWRDDVDLAAWVREYPRFRYGRENADAESAWRTLRTGIFTQRTWGHSILTAYPAVKRPYITYRSDALVKAWGLLLRAQSDLGGTETYRHDLVNIARQALSNHAGQLYARTQAACDAKDIAAYRKSSQAFLQLIYDLDELLATNGEFLLGPWLEDAKRWGQTDAERARLEWNARRVLTLWGEGKTPALRDYAWKEWSGMLSGFYAKRWELFFQRQREALEANRPFDEKACDLELLKLEDQWAGQTERYPTKPVGQSAQVAGRLFEKYMRADPPKKVFGLDRVIAFNYLGGKYDPKQLRSVTFIEPTKPKDWQYWAPRGVVSAVGHTWFDLLRNPVDKAVEILVKGDYGGNPKPIVSIDEFGMDYGGQADEKSAAILRETKRRRPELGLAVWEMRGPIPKVLGEAYRDVVDLVMLESYLKDKDDYWFMAAQVQSARIHGVLPKTIVVLGVGKGGNPGEEWARSKEELEQQIRFARMIAPESPGIGFYSGSDWPELLAKADELCSHYSELPADGSKLPADVAGLGKFFSEHHAKPVIVCSPTLVEPNRSTADPGKLVNPKTMRACLLNLGDRDATNIRIRLRNPKDNGGNVFAEGMVPLVPKRGEATAVLPVTAEWKVWKTWEMEVEGKDCDVKIYQRAR